MIVDQTHTVLVAKAGALIRRDARELAALIHKDFLYVNAGGEAFDKSSYIDAYCTSGLVVFLEQSLSNLQVKQFDGFVVATLVLNDKFAVSEQIFEGSYQSFCVFIAAAEGWQWAAGQTMTYEHS